MVEDRIYLGVFFEDEPLTWGEYVARLERFLRWLRKSFGEFGGGFFDPGGRQPWRRIADDFSNLEMLLGDQELGDVPYTNLDPVSRRLRAESTCPIGFRRFLYNAASAEGASREVLFCAGMGAGRAAGASIWCLSGEPTLDQLATMLKGCVRFWGASRGSVMRESYDLVLGLEPNQIGVGPILFVSDAEVANAVRGAFECEQLEGGYLVRVGGVANRVPESDDAKGMSAVRELKDLLEARGLLEIPGT